MLASESAVNCPPDISTLYHVKLGNRAQKQKTGNNELPQLRHGPGGGVLYATAAIFELKKSMAPPLHMQECTEKIHKDDELAPDDARPRRPGEPPQTYQQVCKKTRAVHICESSQAPFLVKSIPGRTARMHQLGSDQRASGEGPSECC